MPSAIWPPPTVTPVPNHCVSPRQFFHVHRTVYVSVEESRYNRSCRREADGEYSPSTMRWFQTLLSVTLLVTGALALKQSSEERFNKFQTKSLSSTPVKLSDVTYKSITAAPRDYSVTVLLTALDPRYGCDMCQGFQSEWELLAKSWTKGDKKAESRMLFGTLDFTNGRDTFLSVCLLPRQGVRPA